MGMNMFQRFHPFNRFAPFKPYRILHIQTVGTSDTI
jgi:hypothetical protein